MGPRRRGRPAQCCGELGLPGRHLLGSPALLVTEPEPLLGGIVERPQQLPLPVVPGPRTDRANVDHGQHQQQPQPLGTLHRADEIVDRLGVGQVALEGGGAHQQMVAHQPGDGLGFGRIEAEARAQFLRHGLAEHAMITAPSLGDIVEQHRDI